MICGTAPAILDFRHNSGTRNWTSPWNEMEENDGPAAGNIRLERNDSWDRIVIQEQANDADGWTRVKGVGRATDLSTATTAVLSFVYKRVSMEGNDFVKLEITSDRGATWYEIARFGAAADATFQSVSSQHITLDLGRLCAALCRRLRANGCRRLLLLRRREHRLQSAAAAGAAPYFSGYAERAPVVEHGAQGDQPSMSP